MPPKEEIIGQGRELFRQGDKSVDLYFIVEGEVELSIRPPEAKNDTVIATLGPKQVLGAMSFLHGDARSATAKAKTQVKYMRIDAIQRDKMLASLPAWANTLIRHLTSTIVISNDRMAHLETENLQLSRQLEAKDKRIAELMALK